MKLPPSFRLRSTRLTATILLSAFVLVPVSRLLWADAPASLPGDANPVHSLGAMPTAAATLPQGPNEDVYTSNCLICHSNRYVFMQPKFTHKMWEAEVTKMAHVYGAPVSPEQQAQIVEYLYSIRGKPDLAAQTVAGGDSSAQSK